MLKAAEKAGYDMTQKAGTSYGLHFAKDGTPAGGEKAETVSFDFWGKMTYMIYDKETHKYGYREYSMDLYDGVTGDREAFTNVFVIRTDVYNEGVYHVADLQGSGDGYYACGGKDYPHEVAPRKHHRPLHLYPGKRRRAGSGAWATAISVSCPCPVTWSGNKRLKSRKNSGKVQQRLDGENFLPRRLYIRRRPAGTEK